MRPHSKKSIVLNLCLAITVYVKLKIKNIKCGYILVIIIVNIVIVIFYFILIVGEIYKKKNNLQRRQRCALCITFLQNELVLSVSINEILIILQNIVHIFVRQYLKDNRQNIN